MITHLAGEIPIVNRTGGTIPAGSLARVAGRDGTDAAFWEVAQPDAADQARICVVPEDLADDAKGLGLLLDHPRQVKHSLGSPGPGGGDLLGTVAGSWQAGAGTTLEVWSADATWATVGGVGGIRRPLLTYVFYADLIYDGGTGNDPKQRWSGGGIDPAAENETKNCWHQRYRETMATDPPIILPWMPVRAGTIRRVSAWMGNLLTDDNQLQVCPVWTVAGTPCPSDSVLPSVLVPAVTLSNAANQLHSALLTQHLDDDYRLSIQLRAAAAQVDGVNVVVSGGGLIAGQSPNGVYVPLPDPYNGKTDYYLAGLPWHTFWHAASSRWVIYGGGAVVWQKDATGDPPTGTYEPVHPAATGNPTVAMEQVSGWGTWDYENDTGTDRPMVTAFVEYEPD